MEATTDSSSSSSSSGGTATPAAKKIKVGLVTDIGGLNDRSFNQSAYQGLQRAQKELGVDIRVVTSKQNSDYVPNLTSLARQKYDLVDRRRLPHGRGDREGRQGVPDDQLRDHRLLAAGDEEQARRTSRACCSRSRSPATSSATWPACTPRTRAASRSISSVGGQKIPPVDHYIAGYQAGAKAANPDIKTLNAYSQDFVAPDKCKELALNQIAAGSQVVFQVAGGCGLGALDAAKEKSVQGIGVDADQAYLGSHIMTSALKKVDVAVFDTIKSVQDGKFQGAPTRSSTSRSAAPASARPTPRARSTRARSRSVADKIKSGEIADIPDTVK